MVRPHLSFVALLAIAGFAVAACGGSSHRPAAPAQQADIEDQAEEDVEPGVDDQPEPDTGPEVVLTEEEIEIGDRIQFRTGKAELVDESKEILDKVVQILDDNPEIAVVRIEGHTDARGSRKYNRKLSRKRARAVRQYLIDRGVSGDRLEIKGYGQGRPLAKNSTRDGRHQNRRVEFKILERN